MFVKLRDGTTISRADLPDKNTKRWVASRKVLVVRAVNGGLISAADACELYGLSGEEFQSWSDAVKRYGVKALKTTTLQKYRQL